MSDDRIAIQTYHVSDKGIAATAQALVDALNGVKRIQQTARQQAQQQLVAQSPGVVSASEKAVVDIKQKYKLLIPADKKRLPFKLVKQQKNEISAKRHELGDPIVKSFEKSYLATRVTAAAVLKVLADFTAPGYVIETNDTALCKEVFISAQSGGAREKALELYMGKNRFIKAKEGDSYRHRSNGREYVEDWQGFFVSRYVVRGMNAADRKRIDDGLDPSMLATGPKMPTDDAKLKAAIYAHCRSKSTTAEGTSFISVSHTKHKVTGSTGAVFGNSASGSAIMDLANVPKAHRIDLHTPEAVESIFGVTDIDVDMPRGKKNKEAWNDNATARDVVRTREILIADEIPAAAVIAVRLGATGDWRALNAVSHKPDTTKVAALPAGVPKEW